MGFFQDSTWGLMDRQTTDNRTVAAVGIKRLLDDRSWAIIGDSSSESDVGKRIEPERRKLSKLKVWITYYINPTLTQLLELHKHILLGWQSIISEAITSEAMNAAFLFST